MAEPAFPVATDPARCPLCAGDNQCAAETRRRTGLPQPPCWCTRATFPAALLARVPEAARGRACVCAGCVEQPAP
jgi:hypothetical protein